MTMSQFRLCAFGSLLLLRAACTQLLPAPDSLPSSSPVFRLQPQDLGRVLMAHQRLSVYVDGEIHRLEVLLEADADALRVALFSVGQSGARLEWDGRRLHQTNASWWPELVQGERVLSDLQLVLWPAAAIRAVLPVDWTLAEGGGERVLRHRLQNVITIRYIGSDRVEFTHRLDGYRLIIESHSLAETS